MSIFVGRQTPSTRLRAWVGHASEIEQRLQSKVKSAGDYFEYLYVTRDDQHRTVQLFAGRHPIGTTDRGKLLVEGGAALVVSQDAASGNVYVLIYPYERDHKASQPIHWAWFDGPEDVLADSWLDQAAQDFAICCRASSIVDPTVKKADRIRMGWLQLKSRWMLLLIRFPGMANLCFKPTIWGRLWKIIAVLTAGTVGILAFSSSISTLSGITVPMFLKSWNANDSTNSASSTIAPPSNPATPASAPVGPIPITQSAPESGDMPIISGDYTFCTHTKDAASQKLLSLLYDVRSNAGKIAFFNVRIRVDCVLGSKQTEQKIFRRSQEDATVGYSFDVPLIPQGDTGKAKVWLDGERSPETLRAMYSDNGSAILVHRKEEGRNPLSRFQPHVEGQVDILFGPYAIKASEDDDALSYDLYAPTLDSAALQRASAVATHLRQSP